MRNLFGGPDALMQNAGCRYDPNARSAEQTRPAYGRAGELDAAHLRGGLAISQATRLSSATIAQTFTVRKIIFACKLLITVQPVVE